MKWSKPHHKQQTNKATSKRQNGRRKEADAELPSQGAAEGGAIARRAFEWGHDPKIPLRREKSYVTFLRPPTRAVK